MMTFEQWEKRFARKQKRTLALKIIGVIILLITLFWCIVYLILETPDVEFSWSTKQCVHVIYGDGTTGTCDKMPSRYNHVWVE